VGAVEKSDVIFWCFWLTNVNLVPAITARHPFWISIEAVRAVHIAYAQVVVRNSVREKLLEKLTYLRSIDMIK